jgi:hypothetical protein
VGRSGFHASRDFARHDVYLLRSKDGSCTDIPLRILNITGKENYGEVLKGPRTADVEQSPCSINDSLFAFFLIPFICGGRRRKAEIFVVRKLIVPPFLIIYDDQDSVIFSALNALMRPKGGFVLNVGEVTLSSVSLC